MRGGTSRGPFFLESDLPSDIEAATACCSPRSARRTAGGSTGSAAPIADEQSGHRPPQLEARRRSRFLFAQVMVDRAVVDTTPNCGNMLAAVVPSRSSRPGAAAGRDDHDAGADAQHRHAVRDVTVQTPRGRSSARARRSTACRARGADRHQLPRYGRLGLLGPAAHRERAGSPHGGRQGFDPFSIDVTCIDNGMPLVIMRAADMGRPVTKASPR